MTVGPGLDGEGHRWLLFTAVFVDVTAVSLRDDPSLALARASVSVTICAQNYLSRNLKHSQFQGCGINVCGSIEVSQQRCCWL